MILDEQGLFSNNQKITATAVSTNVLDLGKREVAFGTPVEVFIQVTEDFAGCTSIDFEVQTATDEAFTIPVSLVKTGAIPVASLKAGYVAPINFIPKGNLGYLRLYYDVTGSSATAGKITAGIVAANEGSYHNM